MFDDVRALYSDEIRRHGRSPSHAGRLPDADARAKGDNPMCGDRVEVFIRRSGPTISRATFDARGCEISIASADLMCEAVSGLDADQIHTLADDVEHLARTGACPSCGAALQPLSAVHEFPSRVKCVTLPWRALLAALDGGKESSSE
ncbi:MAG: SUF system NifU family Fe-S cluster assembly protein [Pseudomonadota bacterium]|nr:SUF system NifU family Fe-S cluster assembly protein [Pseudomonadota bacterium]